MKRTVWDDRQEKRETEHRRICELADSIMDREMLKGVPFTEQLCNRAIDQTKRNSNAER